MHDDEILWGFVDLKKRGIVRNHAQLKALIDDHGFPPGIWLGVNTHRWTGSSICEWSATRPRGPSPHVQARAAKSIAVRRRLRDGATS